MLQIIFFIIFFFAKNLLLMISLQISDTFHILEEKIETICNKVNKLDNLPSNIEIKKSFTRGNSEMSSELSKSPVLQKLSNNESVINILPLNIENLKQSSDSEESSVSIKRTDNTKVIPEKISIIDVSETEVSEHSEKIEKNFEKSTSNQNSEHHKKIVEFKEINKNITKDKDPHWNLASVLNDTTEDSETSSESEISSIKNVTKYHRETSIPAHPLQIKTQIPIKQVFTKKR